MKQIKEIRSNEQIQASVESRRIEGYAVVFNSESVDLGGFTEIIAPGAITDETIRKSDILFLLDHQRERGVLARSKYGSGSLSISIDEHGVKYSFDAPNTALGDEVLEGLRRNDINKCSFAFSVAQDSWVKREDSTILRSIEQVELLYDLSIVINPAYECTEVYNKRGLEALMSEEREVTPEEEEKPEETDASEKTPAEDETKEEVNEDKQEEREADPEEIEDNKDSSEDETPNEDAEETKEERHNLYLKENHTNISNNMNKNKFSIVGAIQDIVNHRNLDEATLNVIKEGRSAADRAGISANGQIVLPIEVRAEGDTPATPTKPVNGLMATEAEIGKETIATDLWDVQGALRDRLVLTQAGAQLISAQGNIEIPVYDGSNVYWESEIGEAKDGAGKFSKVTLSPKRLTAFVDISKQLINQSSESVETMIREDLINAIAEKLQKTVLGNGAGSDVEPAGIFKGVTADTAAFTYDDAVNMEAALENANVYGDFKYVVSPSSKALLRTTSLDKGSGKFLYESNEVLGIPAYSTCSAVSKGVLLGDFRQLVIANFGALDIVVDEVSRAHFGQIRLVVNYYVDYAVKRPEAFVKRILK